VLQRFTPVVDGWLTREEFIELYDCASDLTHAGNPYVEKQVYLTLLNNVRRTLRTRSRPRRSVFKLQQLVSGRRIGFAKFYP
jgi:hypothetical protein